MDDRELDDILKEIKSHTDGGESPEDALPKAAKEDEPAEKAPVEEAPAEEAPAEPELTVTEETPAEEAAEEANAEAGLTVTEEAPAEEATEVLTDGAAEEETPAEEAPAEETGEPSREVPEDEIPAEETDILSLIQDEPDGTEEPEPADDKKKKIIIAVIAAVLVIAICVGVYFAFFRKPAEEPVTTEPVTEITTEAPAPVISDLNPLTGEAGFSKDAIGKRPIAVVVENEFGSNDYAQQSRPQWGLEEADMVMEGETEFATRLLLFWADYTKVAEKVGPARSARPPFIRFSEKFDAIFIHAGFSHSKGDYVGADSVFKSDNVDHVNLLEYSEGKYSGNDKSRSIQEHQHYFKGESAPDLIAVNKFRTKANQERYTHFAFNEKIENVGEGKAETVKIKWSDNAGKRGTFKYDAEKGMYTTTDFNSTYGTVEPWFENIIVLADNTEYIVKENYKGSGHSETYCNYKLDGGKGMVVSNGTYTDITWKLENKKIVLRKADGSEVKLNPGKVYIAYISANHNGSYSAEAETAE
ncbi:MAG: DUF3048 domain-containing protein [Eubacterium sp.]|nr:DUF3048 domain-containing protein [Eubacterium sp.]